MMVTWFQAPDAGADDRRRRNPASSHDAFAPHEPHF
jgi:hypothetical protein